MGSERPAARSHKAPGPGIPARQDNVRAETVERLARWKRGIGVGAVVAFGALIGLIGVAGTRGSSSPSGNDPPRSPPMTSQANRSGDDDEQGLEPNEAPDDGFFGGQSGGYGFGANGSQSAPSGRSGAS